MLFSPDFFTFDQQSDEYRLSVLPDGVPILSVEVMSPDGLNTLMNNLV